MPPTFWRSKPPADFWRDKTVLVTGGTGTFGHAFARLILQRPIRALLIFSRDELKQMEMRRAFPDERVRFIIGDVRDLARISDAAAEADVLIHAAALKQITTCEANPSEAIAVNVRGSANVATVVAQRHIPAIALSSDKAAAPLNLYGATKLAMERLFLAAGASCTRYGNVVGSRGSAVEVFRWQKANGLPLTITDDRMTRFWITADQAAAFVAECIQKPAGHVYIPKLPSVRVMDLAEAIDPGGARQYVGPRKGEKLHEYLLAPDELMDLLTFEQLPHASAYKSSDNPDWLTVEEIRDALAALS